MKFKEILKSEILKDKFSSKDLLIPKYLIENENNIKIFFAPFDYVNVNADIVIVGITPGWSQMEIAYRTFLKSLNEKNGWTKSLENVKKEASFAGAMRINLIKMLDELGINRKLKIASSSELFEKSNSMLHSTSLLKYPVFVNEKNYTGNNPSPIKSDLMWNFVLKNFIPEINSFKNKLVIPLGKSVSEVLVKLNSDKLLNKNIFLENFPHPSGANGHRKKQFDEHKYFMSNQIKNWKV